MNCSNCGTELKKSFLNTDVTQLKNSILIIRNIPCYKCPDCGEIFYSEKVIKRLVKIEATVENNTSEIVDTSIVEYSKAVKIEKEKKEKEEK